jgi:prepilin-type N-terminal cleavage/methylation domain-containing protein
MSAMHPARQTQTSKHPQHPIMKRLTTNAAFTLIELLVVISIIALLAGIAMPVFGVAVMQGKMIAALNKAKQIGTTLHIYANDHGGTFPHGKNDFDEQITNANDAFRGLIPAYLDSESIFVVPGSKAGATADNRISSAAQILERGENHWAYVAGLTSTSNSGWPLVVDHTDGSGTYTPKENTFGGTWKGTKAVVIHVDSSATLERLIGTGDQRYIPRTDERTANALNTNYMGDDVKLLEPAR